MRQLKAFIPSLLHLFSGLNIVLLTRPTPAQAAVLVDFQVAQPPPVPRDAKQCTIQVLQRDFAFSFGLAEVVELVPPTDCGAPGTWAAITLNFTVTSNGTQLDRLGIFTFKNVEIWRTSTPEPTPDGIIWTYVKDVTRYMPLFETNGTFILQLDNLIETGLNGIYSTVLHATYYASSARHPPAPKSDLIIPLSTLLNNTGNDASVPPDFSINVTLPQNTVQVFAELFASGNNFEETWYMNAVNQFFPDLPVTLTNPQGPFREVRLLIDGQLAGSAFPYATIFTGGINPAGWRPITSYGALDLPTYFIDVTPFVPYLTDGNPHEFSLDVVSAEDNHTILQNWFVSGLLQVITDSSSKRTTGKITSYNASPFAVTSSSGIVGADGDVNITVTASRQIHVEADIVSGSGKTTHVVWTQDLAYRNVQNYLNNFTVWNTFQSSTGTVSSTHNGVPAVSDVFSFPIVVNLTFFNPEDTFFHTIIDHSYDRELLPAPFILQSTIHEHQLATGFFLIGPLGFSGTGNGTSNNTFSYVDGKGNTFFRQVDAALDNITFDRESGSLAPSNIPTFPTSPLSESQLSGPVRLPGGRVIGN